MKEVLCRKDLLNLKNKIKNTFKETDPFGMKGEIFTDLYTDKVILYPVDGYRLDKNQFYALIKTCQGFEVSKIYFSEVEGYDLIELDETELEGKYLSHYYEMTLSNKEVDILYKEYLQMELIIENAIFTKSGEFGILVSQEEHVVFGSKKNFWILLSQCTQIGYIHVNILRTYGMIIQNIMILLETGMKV